MEEILEEFSESAIERVRSLTPDFFTKDIQASFSQLGDLNLTQSLPILDEYFPLSDLNGTEGSYDDHVDTVAEDEEEDHDERSDDPLPLVNGDVESSLDDEMVKRFVDGIVGSVDLTSLKDTLEKAASNSLDAKKTSLARQVGLKRA